MPSFPNRLTVSRRGAQTHRRGQTLAEFAVVTFVLYLLVGGILTFGYAIYAAQGLQQAADVAAREISRTPLPADKTLEEVLYADANGDGSSDVTLEDVRNRVFDHHYLVLIVNDPNDPSRNFHGRASMQELIADLPVVNQQVFPLMISDFIDGGADPIQVVRYPGLVVTDGNPDDNPGDPESSGFLVEIPLSDGTMLDVVEEIHSSTNPNPFQLSSTHRGLVALRINYPWHSPFLIGADSNNTPVPTDGSTGLSLGNVIDDETGQPTGLGPYAGAQGFGKQNALAQEVRPFRKLISAQAIYRREVFSP